MQNKQNKQVVIANQQKDIYIVNKIASNLNKFAFIVIIQQESLIVFLSIDNASNLEQQINQIDVIINKTNINNFKIKYIVFDIVDLLIQIQLSCKNCIKLLYS